MLIRRLWPVFVMFALTVTMPIGNIIRLATTPPQPPRQVWYCVDPIASEDMGQETYGPCKNDFLTQVNA